MFAPALLGDPTLRWIRGPGANPDPGGPAYGIGLLSRLPVTAVAIAALPGGGPGEARPRRPDSRRPRSSTATASRQGRAAGDGGGSLGTGGGHDRAPDVRAVAGAPAARHGYVVERRGISFAVTVRRRGKLAETIIANTAGELAQVRRKLSDGGLVGYVSGGAK